MVRDADAVFIGLLFVVMIVFQRYLHLGLGKVFWFGWTGLIKGVGGVGLGGARR